MWAPHSRRAEDCPPYPSDSLGLFSVMGYEKSAALGRFFATDKTETEERL